MGLSIGHFGGSVEHRLAANQYRAWRTVALATLMRTPRWGQPAVGAGLRFGQAYGTPLLLGVMEEMRGSLAMGSMSGGLTRIIIQSPQPPTRTHPCFWTMCPSHECYSVDLG